MIPTNFWMIFLVSFLPLILGYSWYHPKVMGGRLGIDKSATEAESTGKMLGNLLVLYILSCLFTFVMQFVVIHQYHLYSILSDEVGFKDHTGRAYNDFMMMYERYGSKFRTFGHGALHGLINSIFMALPILAIVSRFEQREWRKIMVHFGFWVICSTLVGGLVCKFNG